MTSNLTHASRSLLITIFLSVLTVTLLQAQTDDVCEDNGCSPDIFSVRLDQPLQGAVTPQRTAQFKTAYLQVKQIKSTLSQDPAWESQYNANQMGGRSCLRLNQLESNFAFEYENNPDFQKFIDQNEEDILAFKEDAFESSRRALNLETRMGKHCPQEVKKVEKAGEPSLEDQPKVFMKLGQVLGYFDEKGNMIKPLKPVSEEVEEKKPEKKLSKKEQVAELQEQVSGLPLGPQKSAEVAAIAEGFKAARPKQDQLHNSLEGLEPRFAALQPQPSAIQNKLETNKDALHDLQSFKPQFPKNDLSPKIDKLLEDGKEISKNNQDLEDKTNKLKGQYDQITTTFDDLQGEVAERIAATEKMQGDLDDLIKRKEALTAQLDDKPKKILEELTQQVKDINKEADDLSKKIEAENQQKEEVLGNLDKLIKDEEEVADQLGKLEKEAEKLAQDQAELEEEIKKLQWEAEEIKKEEAKVAGLDEQLANLKSEDALKERIAICEEGLKKQQEEIEGVEAVQDKYKKETAELYDIPNQIVGKLSDLKLFLNKLKLGYDEIPVTDKELRKIEQLLEKANIIGSSVEIITDKQKKLQEQIDGFDENMEKAKELYTSMTGHLNDLQTELTALTTEKAGLQGKLKQGVEDVEQTDALVNDFLERYSTFVEKTKCSEEEEVAALQKEQAAIEAELKSLGAELTEMTEYEEKLKQETTEVDQKIQLHTEQMKQLKEEEKVLKEEFGEDLVLQPVSAEEWKEADQVERPYWEATVHPDNELVRGFKGKYFEINLKDAEKNAKVLFNSGRYFIDQDVFLTNYGATLGSFVNEALYYIKKSDEGKIKLFIQGSADIAGHETFRGKLDPDYNYEELMLLPLDEDKEHFLGESETVEVSATSFRNDDLPNLRARYLKEILGAYSSKFDPIMLEGTVQESEGKEDRNATIYLFFPEDILQIYGGD